MPELISPAAFGRRLQPEGCPPIDWRQFVDGRPRRLIYGDDFVDSPESVRQSAYRAASMIGMKAIAKVEGSNVKVQFIVDGDDSKRRGVER